MHRSWMLTHHLGVSIRAENEENHGICPLCKHVIDNEAFNNAATAILVCGDE